jgi:AraC family transcriptional activator of pyochelin receptor
MPFELKHIGTDQVLHASEASNEDVNDSRLRENIVKIALPFADAALSHWSFDGIRIMYNDWHYKSRSDMAFKSDLDLVQLHFNLRGRIHVNAAEYERPLSFEQNEHNILYSAGNGGTLVNEHLHTTQFLVQFTKETFLNLTGDANDTLKRFTEKILGGKPVLLSEQHLPVDPSMQQAIDAIINCKYQSGLKKIFLLSKAIEILVLQAEAFDRAASRKKIVAKTDYDKDRIHYAREYLVQHIETPPSLSELAREAGLNEYKLKRGFKEQFQTTVFGYLAEKRMELAKTYLLDYNKSVTEIADSLGYSSIQHFSYAFKKKFGHSPKHSR